jgi:hypothetical protein
MKRKHRTRSTLRLSDMTEIMNEKPILPKFVSKIILRKRGKNEIRRQFTRS